MAALIPLSPDLGMSGPAAAPRLAAPTRVVPPEAMPPWIEWSQLPAWIEQVRAERLAAVEAELAQERERLLEALHTRLEAEHAERERQLGLVQVRALQQLHARLDAWGQDFAQRGATLIADALQRDPSDLAALLAGSLRHLLDAAGDGLPLSIHCAESDLDLLHAALAELPASARVQATVGAVAEVAPGQCLLRVGEQSYEYNLTQWVAGLRAVAASECRDLVAALGLPPADALPRFDAAPIGPPLSDAGAPGADDEFAPDLPHDGIDEVPGDGSDGFAHEPSADGEPAFGFDASGVADPWDHAEPVPPAQARGLRR